MGTKIANEPFINEQIRDKEVRLVGAEGEQLGVMPIAQAQRMAEEANLDLVNISPKANPPVCKIMDYGKFKFEQGKKQKEARKNQKTVEIKEMRLSSTIDRHDMEVKAKNVKKFLSAGDKVKISIRFRGRQIAHTDQGRAVMMEFIEMLDDAATVEKNAKMEGRSMFMILTPKAETKKQDAKPAAKPAPKPAGEPAVKAEAKPAEVAKPAAKPAEAPVAKTEAKPAEAPTAKPAQKEETK